MFGELSINFQIKGICGLKLFKMSNWQLKALLTKKFEGVMSGTNGIGSLNDSHRSSMP